GGAAGRPGAAGSRVLRGATNVSENAREAVLQAARETAYAPNHAARSLVTRRSDAIAFLVAETEDRLFTEPYFFALLHAAHAQIAAAGLQLLFITVPTAAEATRFEHYAAGGHVDGVLLLSLHGDDRLQQSLEPLRVPTGANRPPPSR